MICVYPENSPLNGYRKGCRCERCSTAKRAADKRRPVKPRPCRRCGTLDKPKGGWYCEACSPLVLLDRVVSKVYVDGNGCWIYTGTRTGFGYGNISGHRGRHGGVAHRIVYEHFVGKVPDGLQLDHLCRVPACCNPDHLEPVTPQENVRRGALATGRTHGRRSTYRSGCKCEQCRGAWAAYQRDLAFRKREAAKFIAFCTLLREAWPQAKEEAA